jgi:hypothetical protein
MFSEEKGTIMSCTVDGKVLKMFKLIKTINNFDSERIYPSVANRFYMAFSVGSISCQSNAWIYVILTPITVAALSKA